MIILVDDERGADFYVDEMKRLGLPVKYFGSVDEAWDFLEHTRKRLEIAILDLMMPPGTLFSLDDTEEGRLTGLHFYRLIRTKFPDCPVFLLTNLAHPAVQDAARSDPAAEVRIKTDMYYDEFAAEIAGVLAMLRDESETK